MHVRLEIEADCAADLQREVARLFPAVAVNVAIPGQAQVQRDKVVTLPAPEPEVQEETAAEEPVTPAPKKQTRTKRGAAKEDTDASSGPVSTPESGEKTSDNGPTATTSAPPSEVTLDDIRNKASTLMDAGKQTGADIQKMLVDKFGARAFGQLKPEQYADVIGELNNLG